MGLDLGRLLRQSDLATWGAPAIVAVEFYGERDSDSDRRSQTSRTIRRTEVGAQWEVVDDSGSLGRPAAGMLPRYFKRYENRRERRPESDLILVGQDVIDGLPVWVVWYEITVPTFDDDPVAYRTEWIDQRSLRLLRQVQH